MTHLIHPELHLALHRFREEETARHWARVPPLSETDSRRSWVIRLGPAVVAAVAAGRLAFAETAAVRATTGEGAGR